MRRLVIVPDADRVEQWLIGEARHTDFVDLRAVCTFSQLVEKCAPPEATPADPLLARMSIGRLAREHAAHAFGQSAHTAEFAAQAHELMTQLRGQASTVRQFEMASSALEGNAYARAKALASLWRALDVFLEERGVVDRAELLRLAAQRLSLHGLPPALSEWEAIEVQHLHDVAPARLALLEALARACTAAGIAFVWRWPGSGQVATDAFIIDSVREAEARWQALEVDLEVDVPDGPLAWVGPHIFAEEVHPRAANELTAFCAPSNRDEAREIARRVRQLVSAGVPAETIGITYRELGEDTELLVQALAEMQVPVRANLGIPLSQSQHGRLALTVLQLADEGFPSEALATLLESTLVKVLKPEASGARRTFREAGLRDDVVGANGGKGAYAVRLEKLAARSGAQARRIRLLAEGVAHVLEWCRSVPEQATALEMVEAWWDVLSKLGLLDSPRFNTTVALSDSMKAEVDLAMARQHAAVEALGQLLSSFKDSLVRSGLAQQIISRPDLSRWVGLATAEMNLPSAGARVGAVRLLDARELPGHRFTQLFIGGLTDGRFPGRTPPQALLSEEERGMLNREAKQALFRTGVGEGDVRLPTRLAEDRLLFHLALSSAASVTVSRSRFDDAGRDVLASPFGEALARGVADFQERAIPRAVVPLLEQLQTEAQLRVRAALEALSPTSTRQTQPDERRHALRDALAHEPWFQTAQQKGRIENERLRFFTDPSVSPGLYTGKIDGEVLDALQGRLAFDSAHPLASYELTQWGTCAFRGLSSTVLGLEGGEHAGEELDPRAKGSFWHDVLAKVVMELSEAGLLGKDEPSIRARLENAVAHSAQHTALKSATGHPALWTLAQEWAVKVLHRVVTSPDALPFGLAKPKYLEVSFGDRHAPAELAQIKIPAMQVPEKDVYLTGRMDRVDAGEGVVGVLDYKSNVSRTLGPDFLRREFQMAFYLYAAAKLLPDVTPTGAWLGLGRNELRSVQGLLNKGSVEELLATDELRRARAEREGRPNLANAVHKLLSTLRRGDFGARPLDCEYCALKPVCRISQRQLTEEGP